VNVYCDECKEEFDVLAGGYSSQYVTACATCWAVEVKRREIGGVFSRAGA